MNDIKSPTSKNRTPFLLFAILALLFFALVGAAFSWKSGFSDPAARVKCASAILVVMPGSSDKSPHGVVSSVLKGDKDAGLALTAGSPMLGVFEKFLTAPRQPEALVVFMGPRYLVAGPLKVQAIAAVYDGKIEGTNESLLTFLGKFPGK